jgi:hypothetical protein
LRRGSFLGTMRVGGSYLCWPSAASVVADVVVSISIAKDPCTHPLTGRLAVWFAVLGTGGMIGTLFYQSKGCDYLWLALLGAGVATSWLVMLGPTTGTLRN